jgi:hypothetical protein
VIASLSSANILYAIDKVPSSDIFNNPGFISELLRLHEKKILNQVINMNIEQLNKLPLNLILHIFMTKKLVAIHMIHISRWTIFNRMTNMIDLNYILWLVKDDARIFPLLPVEIKNNQEFLRAVTDYNPNIINQVTTSLSTSTISNIASGNLQTLLTYLLASPDAKIKTLTQKAMSTWNLNTVNETWTNLLMALIESADPNSQSYASTILDQEWINVNQISLNDETPLNLAIKHRKLLVAKKILEKRYLFAFKMPKWNKFKTLKWLMKDNHFPQEIISMLINHPKNNLINKYL